MTDTDPLAALLREGLAIFADGDGHDVEYRDDQWRCLDDCPAHAWIARVRGTLTLQPAAPAEGLREERAAAYCASEHGRHASGPACDDGRRHAAAPADRPLVEPHQPRQLRVLGQQPGDPVSTPLFVIFDGPPGPVSGRFVEVETAEGVSVNAGEWKDLGGGLWSLGPLLAAPAEGLDVERLARAMHTVRNGQHVLVVERDAAAIAREYAALERTDR